MHLVDYNHNNYYVKESTSTCTPNDRIEQSNGNRKFVKSVLIGAFPVQST